MNESEIRKIVQDELKRSAVQAQYGVSRVPVHTHNNIDSPNLSPNSVNGFQDLTGAGTTALPGVIAAAVNQYVVGPPSEALFYNPATSTPPPIPKIITYPIPVIYGHGVGTASAFNGGDAPIGTMIFFDNGVTLSNLWIKTESGWYGINVDTLI